jgi:hypothetical protein
MCASMTENVSSRDVCVRTIGQEWWRIGVTQQAAMAGNEANYKVEGDDGMGEGDASTKQPSSEEHTNPTAADARRRAHQQEARLKETTSLKDMGELRYMHAPMDEVFHRMYESDTMGIRSAHSVVLPAHVLNTDPTIPIYDIFPSAHNGLFSSENKKKKSEKKTRPAQAERAHRISANADDILLRLLGNTELSPSSIGMMNDLGIGVNQPSMGVNSPPLREQVLSPPFVFHLMATPPLLREHIFGALFQTASAAGEHWVPEVSVASGAHAPSPSHHMTESALVYIASGALTKSPYDGVRPSVHSIWSTRTLTKSPYDGVRPSVHSIWNVYTYLS